MPFGSIDRVFSRQLLLAALVATGSVVLIVTLGWWAAREIDEQALRQDVALARTGLQDLVDRLPKEQDSSALWDSAVIAVRNNDGDWLAENLVEWVGAYYGHDYVFVLRPDNTVLRAAVDGELADPTVFSHSFDQVLAVAERLRSEMAAVSQGEADSTEAISGMGAIEFSGFEDGTVGLISVRPIVPETDEVSQAPGEEFLHVSVELLDHTVLAQMERRYILDDLRITDHQPEAASAIAIGGGSGEPIAWLVWQADRPAAQLIARTAPGLLLALCIGWACFVLLLWRLRNTSKDLQVSEAQARHLAFHDQLTGIPNRALFEDRLDRALANSRRNATRTALLYLDVDRFKHVNDTLGHHAGDQLVRLVAARLTAVVREVDTVARIGGDEFAVVQVDVSGPPDVATLGEALLATFEEPFTLEDDEIKVGASIGGAIQHDVSVTSVDLMRQADIALYQAKGEGRGQFRLFAGEMDDVVMHRRSLERDLRLALQGREGLALAYQPIYSAGSGQVLGAEALLRWTHPEHGLLPATDVVALAEERGLIDKLGCWALRQAARFAVHHDLPSIAVNVSPLQFHDERLADKVLEIVQDAGLDTGKLQLEITEGVLLQSSDPTQETIRRLRAAGIAIALDDFGTGYSSITYLRTYGVDKLKIDRSFVAKLGVDREIDSIVKAIIDLAMAMGMSVTAEGVETQAQLEMLRRLDCEEVQGYLLSLPISGEEMAAMLARTSERESAS